MAELLSTQRLVLRDWQRDDAPEALAVYGHHIVRPWMTPVLQPIPNVPAMRELLEQWAHQQPSAAPGTGHWAITRLDGTVVGGTTLRTLPADEDVEIAFQLRPEYWGHGYATEAVRGLARHAFAASLPELFALIRPRNTRAAATARRVGMQWVGQTDKYYGVSLHAYRLRPPDLTG